MAGIRSVRRRRERVRRTAAADYGRPAWYYRPSAFYGYGALGLGYFYYDPFWGGYSGYGYAPYGGYYGGPYYGGGYYGAAAATTVAATTAEDTAEATVQGAGAATTAPAA